MLDDPYALRLRLFTNEAVCPNMFVISASRRNRIKAFPTPWLTAPDAAQTQPTAAKQSVRLDRLKKIVRTGRLEATARARASEK